jgi:hypothetical protein
MTMTALSTSALNPAQDEVVRGLMALGEERPAYDPDLALRLRRLLDDGLAPAVARLHAAGASVTVFKHALTNVLQCEGMASASHERGFSWSPSSARGTIAHKAIELSVFSADHPSPMELIDRAVSRLVDGADPWGPGAYLAQAGEGELAELRAEANDRVVKFLECFPPLKRQWRPTLESRARVDLHGGAVVLKGKVDLSLGRRDGGDRAKVLIVDFKSGGPHRGHVDDLRFYALLDTLRSGVPPFRVATYYLDAARWQHEDIDGDVLEAAVHRTIAGATKLVDLATTGRPPKLSPGSACAFCPARDGCDGARRSMASVAGSGGVASTDPAGVERAG